MALLYQCIGQIKSPKTAGLRKHIEQNFDTIKVVTDNFDPSRPPDERTQLWLLALTEEICRAILTELPTCIAAEFNFLT